MTIFRTDDPHADFAAHEAYCEAQLEKLPLCDCCGERIQEDFYIDFDGYLVCEECLDKHYKKSTDNYI